METKICPGCKKRKPLTKFYKNKAKANGIGIRCIECNKAYSKDWYKKNKVRNYKRTYAWRDDNWDEVRSKALQKKYGIDLREYNRILDAQGGVCAICFQEETIVDYRSNRKRSLSVDHCHKTGAIRGLLCFKCNRILGRIGDSLEGILPWVIYLEKNPIFAHNL
jgi:hypothetical protein